MISFQVLEERIHHIEYVPSAPEPYYQPSGRELQPRPVGEENGVIVYSYNPISAVNYVSSFMLFSWATQNQIIRDQLRSLFASINNIFKFLTHYNAPFPNAFPLTSWPSLSPPPPPSVTSSTRWHIYWSNQSINTLVTCDNVNGFCQYLNRWPIN